MSPLSLLRPSMKLMDRLRLAHKLALVTLVLLVPAALAARAYLQTVNANIAFSAKERVGVAYLRPAVSLLEATVSARSGRAGSVAPSLDRARSTDASLGGELG